MESIISATYDILKFKAVAYVNTGDKTQDNLINVLVLAILAFIFTFIKVLDLKLWYKEKRYGLNDKYVLDYYNKKETAEKYNLKLLCWDVMGDTLFSNQLLRFFYEIYTAQHRLFYDTKNSKLISKSSTYTALELFQESLRGVENNILHKKNKDVIYIGRDINKNNIHFKYTNFSMLQEFIEKIKKIKIDNIQDKNSDSKLEVLKYDVDNRFVGYIYPDRSFDTYVSKYKQNILDYIQSFQKANLAMSSFGGFGTYNLGLIVYGEPGTGKTFLIKAIANKLKRNVIMVDMRAIKTRKQFKNIFTNHEQYIYCLDEFDCIQGVIKNRENEEEKEAKSNGLQDRYLKVLELFSKQKEKNNNLEKELEDIKKEMSDAEDALTLDSILTVLDGPVEMRNRVIIATTNYIDRIDSALLRHGRFDLKIKLEKFNETEMKELLYLMFKDTSSEEELKRLIESRFKEYVYTPVELIAFASSIGNLNSVLNKLAIIN